MCEEFDNPKVANIHHGRMTRWYGLMLKCVEKLSSAERAEFHKWDSERPDGLATSDWPGFAKYLPARPWDTIN
jgi:hypothetical protein